MRRLRRHHREEVISGQDRALLPEMSEERVLSVRAHGDHIDAVFSFSADRFGPSAHR